MDGQEQLEQSAEKRRQYKQGADQEQAWSEIEELSKIVLDGKVFDENGFKQRSVKAQSALQNLNLAGVENFEEKHPLVQTMYKIGAYFGVVSPYRTADKIEKDILGAADVLEKIAADCYQERDDPRKGIMASLEHSEIKRDSGYELKDKSKEMVTDYDLELADLKKMYKDKEYGPGKKYESAVDLKRQMRATSKKKRNLERLVMQTNLEILKADNEVQGKTQVVEIYDAFTTLLEAEAMKLRAAAIRFRYNPKIAKRVELAMRTLGDNLQTLIDRYDSINERINQSVGEIVAGMGNIEGAITVNTDKGSVQYNPGGMTQKADKIAMYFDTEVEKRRVKLEEEELVY